MENLVPGSILVIDDNPQVLASFRRATRDLPARLRFAHNAEEGWLMVEVEVPEVIICDYRLPGTDGLAFLARVHRHYPSVKRILHTAVAVVAAGGGVDVPVLGKPIAAEDLRTLLLSVITPQEALV